MKKLIIFEIILCLLIGIATYHFYNEYTKVYEKYNETNNSLNSLKEDINKTNEEINELNNKIDSIKQNDRYKELVLWQRKLEKLQEYLKR